jgi:aminomethyltransferase
MSAPAPPASALQRTPLHDRHLALGARMVDFGGWEMPVQYPTGIIAEHLATRSAAGLFDVSHMGRFTLRGPGTVPFLQHVLTNNAEALDPLQAQYTIVPTPTGGAVDDAYLYRFDEAEYLLVVNASNRIKDWEHFQGHVPEFPDVELSDETAGVAMLALQGKQARGILAGLIETGGLPEPFRNDARAHGARRAHAHRPHRLHRRASLLRALRRRGAGAGPVGRAYRRGRRARRSRRP